MIIEIMKELNNLHPLYTTDEHAVELVIFQSSSHNYNCILNFL